jgi:TonB family protein
MMKTVGISAALISVLIVFVGLWAFGHFWVFRNRVPAPQSSSRSQSTDARNPNDVSVAPVTSAVPPTTIDPPLTHVEPSPTQQVADGPVDLPPDVAATMVIAKTMPTYPPLAKAAGISGTVEIQARVSKMGTISNLRVISGPAMLQQPALDAVKTWRYRPYILNGNPVEFQTTAKVTFSLEN